MKRDDWDVGEVELANADWEENRPDWPLALSKRTLAAYEKLYKLRPGQLKNWRANHISRKRVAR